jgi:hypothetical protein
MYKWDERETASLRLIALSLVVASRRLLLDLLGLDSMNKDSRAVKRVDTVSSSTPLISLSICKHLSIAAESKRRDRGGESLKGLASRTSILVPKVEWSIWSTRSKRSLLHVPGEAVDSENLYVIHVRLLVSITMALEGKITSSLTVVHVMDGNTAFDGSESKVWSVGGARNGSCLILERTLDHLVFLLWVVHIENVNTTIRGANDTETIAPICAVNFALQGDRADRSLLSEIPIFQCLVPTSCCQNGSAWCLNPFADLDRAVMLFDPEYHD